MYGGGRRLMVAKTKFYEFSNLPCLLDEVMVKDFLLLLFFTAVVFRKDLIPQMQAGQQAIFWTYFFLQTIA